MAAREYGAKCMNQMGFFELEFAGKGRPRSPFRFKNVSATT